ncbi:CatB-related O-acetyltransferase [Candidatus Babeliales bacterium]|nr:CatB-related O-acetyltransferase [Candidatus Babeliales bacterium]
MIGNSCIKVDKFTYISKGIHVREWGEGAPLSIGKFTAIADDVTVFLGGNHHIEWITTYPFGQIHQDYFSNEDITGYPTTKGGVTIGNDVWIGSQAIIMSGITIGDGAVIATHSVVVKDVEPYAIVGGNPAKFIRYRFDEQTRQALLKLRWWDLEIDQIKDLLPDLCASPDIEKLQFWIQKYRSE